MSPDTNIRLFADDTKIWRSMNSEEDCDILQKDINYLHHWCNSDLMKFHPDKYKVVSVNTRNSSLKLANFWLLPLSRFNYTLGNNILTYKSNEQDLGVIVNNNISWSEQQDKVINKAFQMLGLTERTCHFVVSNHRKRTLYLTLVRSQFEHCSVIWKPVTPTQISKFEALQKNAIKWILNEEFSSYSDYNIYIKKCRDVNILPINKKFHLNDIISFHKIVSGYVHVDLTNYISKFNGVSRLRENHHDLECYTCNLNPSNAKVHSPIYKNYFLQSHTYLDSGKSYHITSKLLPIQKHLSHL